jgi:hypothetical protein
MLALSFIPNQICTLVELIKVVNQLEKLDNFVQPVYVAKYGGRTILCTIFSK